MSSHKPECDAKWGYDHDHCICQWIELAEQRIIKVLEEHAEQKFADNFDSSIDTCHEDVCELCANSNGLGVAIALIKGEK